MDEILAGRERLNQASADFLKVDVETALTFSKIARDADDPEKRRRNSENARKGYETITRLLETVTLSEDDLQLLTRKLRELKSDLLHLGETV